MRVQPDPGIRQGFHQGADYVIGADVDPGLHGLFRRAVDDQVIFLVFELAELKFDVSQFASHSHRINSSLNALFPGRRRSGLPATEKCRRARTPPVRELAAVIQVIEYLLTDGYFFRTGCEGGCRVETGWADRWVSRKSGETLGTHVHPAIMDGFCR